MANELKELCFLFDGLVKNHSLSIDGECTGRMFGGSF